MGYQECQSGPENPFTASTFNGVTYYHVDAENRLRQLKSFNLAQCEAGLQAPGLQKTVANALHARIKKLKKGGQ